MKLLSTPRKAAYVLLALSATLAVTLIVALLAFQDAREARADRIAERAAARAACLQTKPRTTLLLTALRDNATQAALDAQVLLAVTDPDDPAYSTRQATIDRNEDLARVLNDLLPVRCT